MYFELLKDPAVIKHNEKGGAAVLPTGAIGNIVGVPIFSRSRIGIFTSADAIKDVTDSGYSEAVSDLSGGFMWQKDQVAKAETATKVI